MMIVSVALRLKENSKDSMCVNLTIELGDAHQSCTIGSILHLSLLTDSNSDIM